MMSHIPQTGSSTLMLPFSAARAIAAAAPTLLPRDGHCPLMETCGLGAGSPSSGMNPTAPATPPSSNTSCCTSSGITDGSNSTSHRSSSTSCHFGNIDFGNVLSFLFPFSSSSPPSSLLYCSRHISLVGEWSVSEGEKERKGLVGGCKCWAGLVGTCVTMRSRTIHRWVVDCLTTTSTMLCLLGWNPSAVFLG